MTLAEIVKKTEKFTIDNSPLLLTAVGTAGVVTTAVLAGKAGFKAARIIEQEESRLRLHSTEVPRPKLETRNKFALTWKCYIPPMGAGLLTVSAVIAANQIGTRRAAAVAAAYSLSEKAFTEYKEKVVEKLGETKEQAVRDELAQDRVDRHPVSEREVIIVTGEQLCYDMYSGRYFKSDMETLKKAQNDLNHRILSDNYASLTDFYNLIGLNSTGVSDEVGWNVDKMLEIHYSTTLSDDGRPCIALDFQTVPIRDYFRLH